MEEEMQKNANSFCWNLGTEATATVVAVEMLG